MLVKPLGKLFTVIVTHQSICVHPRPYSPWRTSVIVDYERVLPTIRQLHKLQIKSTIGGQVTRLAWGKR